ncbi:lectin C-type domain-containing protein [Mytilinidion resinicola]|uniref:Maintenance of telomere capping protein 6 n=1 Tax=Mytilinidion resinicola TaxID=574789 RepID=A0A6A6Z9N4_9PEZI|nr:lectin C-type domain-containing protein [Mytilinidion resinicola]KAF2817409.1 lectin C-type domain-containing protein [Mytilinidion resinicola]
MTSPYPYDPDPQAVVVAPWSVAFRAQRDVGLKIPINYVTVPAVSLKAACFAHNQYEDSAAQKCFSNLLASGFKRFIIDVYWDTGRSQWSLCPAEIPESASPADDTTSISITQSTSVKSLMTAPISLPIFERQASSISSRSSTPAARTDSATSSTPTLSFTGSSSTSMAYSAAATPTEFPTAGEPLVQIGQYNCTSNLGLQFLSSILSGYLKDTSTTIGASLIYLVLNVHVAAPYSSPNSPAMQPDPSALPKDENFLGHLLSSNLSSYLYTPSMLQSQRGNLNESWRLEQSNLPVAGYYKTNVSGNGIPSTQDGWPTETFMEFKNFLRLVTSFGAVDPQMASYDFTNDADTIFPLNEIISLKDVSISTSGSVTTGCLFNPNITTITSETNSSWAMFPASSLPNLASNPNATIPIPAIMNLTSCGISPLLNASLSNTTADINPLAYLSFSYSTLWSWAPGSPNNSTLIDDNPNNDLRCAALYGDANGRWRAVDCKSSHRVACRGSTPYTWSITPDLFAYSDADQACPDDTKFSTPRTALENAYLYTAALASANTGSSDPGDLPIIYLDLNSLDYADCWVTGANSTCPYKNSDNVNHTKIVVVPTVATVIVFVLAVATFFVKCAANRRDLRRGKRRRNMGGWDYEGVPS